ncbi:MAG: hypothetical protein PWP23_2254 [Candidatus Sumerlaeota bacterium]|nr:hypothetical protein [Candidatus Sumerlaeota bacterium]
MVGATGFEPATSRTPSECATRLRYAPTQGGACVPQVRGQVKGERLSCVKDYYAPLSPGSACLVAARGVFGGMAPTHKRVLLFSYFFPPAATGVRRVTSLVRHLPANGWEPVVLACKPVRGQGHDPGPLADPAVADAPVVRCGSVDPYRLMQVLRPGQPGGGGDGTAAGAPRGKRLMETLRRHLFFPDDRCGWIPFAVAAALVEVRRRRIDALYSSNYPQSTHAAAWIVHRLTGLPWLADFRDGWTQNPAFHRPANTALAWLQQYGERRVARDATAITTVSPPITRHLQAMRTPQSLPAETIFNGFEPGEWESARAESGSAQPLNPGLITLLYAGTFFGRRRPDLFFGALRILLRRHPHWRERLRVRMRCALDDRSLGLIEKWDLLDVVRLHPPVSFAEIVREQLRADACLLILEHGPGADIMVSQKVFEYLAAGRPVFALVPEGAAAEVLAATGGATVETSRNVQAAAKSLLRFLQAVEDARHPAPDPGQVAAFDRSAQARRIAALLDAITPNPRAR